MTDPIHVTARFHARPGQAEALVPLLRELAAHSRGEPGCLGYDYLRRDDLFTSVEIWASAEAERAHNQTAFLDAQLVNILPLLEGKPEVIRWQRI